MHHTSVEDVDQPHPAEHFAHEGCVLCGSNRPFGIPDSVLDAAREGRLVIFAGAGTSTEVQAVYPTTLYSDVRSMIDLAAVGDSFPDVMAAYERANDRPDLVRMIKDRLDYVDSFPVLRRMATRFHRELATMPYVSEIITTNWDRYFEEECGALPIVTDQDYAFYTMPGRKVYKIHGSIEIVSSLVATSQDYDRTLEALRNSALGGTLRHLLATSTVVFVGYSLSDPDFRAIYSALTESMGPMRPDAYAVSPSGSEGADELNLQVIQTDGTYFLHQLKKALLTKGCYLPDEVFDRLGRFHDRIGEAHVQVVRELPPFTYQGVVYCLSYHDGIGDALSRIWTRKKTGEYSDGHRVSAALHTYERALEIALDRERFWDAAYIEGFLSGISVLLTDEAEIDGIPAYFCFTSDDLHSLADLKRVVRGLPRRKDKRAWEEARLMMEKIGPGMIPQHTPFLDGVVEHLDDLQKQEDSPLSAEAWSKVYRAAPTRRD